MATVNISGNNYEVYADEATALAFLRGDIALFAAWDAAESTTRKQALITATRNIDAEDWQGEKQGGDSQVLEFGRDGIDGFTAAETLVKAVDASIIYAGLLVQSTALADQADTGSNVKAAGAGSARVEFFRPTLDEGTRFPTRVQTLIGQFLASSAVSVPCTAFGVDGVSAYDADPGGPDRTEGF